MEVHTYMKRLILKSLVLENITPKEQCGYYQNDGNMEHLIHVIPTIKHKEQGIEYIKEHLEYHSEINGSGSLDRYINDYESWLEKLNQDRLTIPSENRVPAETYYLVRQEDNRIIGMINIRLTLNKRLKENITDNLYLFCGYHLFS